jgi:hypothetical protein
MTYDHAACRCTNHNAMQGICTPYTNTLTLQWSSCRKTHYVTRESGTHCAKYETQTDSFSELTPYFVPVTGKRYGILATGLESGTTPHRRTPTLQPLAPQFVPPTCTTHTRRRRASLEVVDTMTGTSVATGGSFASRNPVRRHPHRTPHSRRDPRCH